MAFISLICFAAKCNAGEEVQEIGGNYECVECDIDYYQPVDTPTIDDRCMQCDDNYGTRTTGSSECEGRVMLFHLSFVD